MEQLLDRGQRGLWWTDVRSWLAWLVPSSLRRPSPRRSKRGSSIASACSREHRPRSMPPTSMASDKGCGSWGTSRGKAYVIEYRSADGRDERFPGLATELVRLKVDLIVTRGTPAALAAKHATGTIPVVITGVGDPVGQGIVASLARPGGNITGLSAAVTEIYPKRVELLRELVPRAARIAGLFNMGNPALPPQWKEVEMAARSLGIAAPAARRAKRLKIWSRRSMPPARQRADALVVGLDTLTQANQRLIVDLAAKHRLPAIYASTEFAGGLVAYGVNYPDMYRRAASFAHKIFKGAKPARPPRRAADEVRAGHQPQDREGPRPDDPTVAPAAGGPGDRVESWRTTFSPILPRVILFGSEEVDATKRRRANIQIVERAAAALAFGVHLGSALDCFARGRLPASRAGQLGRSHPIADAPAPDCRRERRRKLLK